MIVRTVYQLCRGTGHGMASPMCQSYAVERSTQIRHRDTMHGDHMPIGWWVSQG